MSGDAGHAAVAAAICAAAARLHARGLLAGCEGNLSVRLDDGTLLATPAGADKARLAPGDLLHLDARGVARARAVGADGAADTGRRPSSEIRMHVALYAARPDVRAVVHAHPPVATGFATAGRPLPADALPELVVAVGPVALVPYARPGTEALPVAMAPFAASHDAFLLANHGATTVGGTLDAALARMESLEQAARIVAVAELLGGVRPLPVGEVEALAARRSG